MKTTTSLAALVILAAATPSAFSQSGGLSSDGFNSSRINVKPADREKKTTKTVKTVQFVAVSPERESGRAADRRRSRSQAHY